MCGISGIVARKLLSSHDNYMSKMLDVMNHRGPDYKNNIRLNDNVIFGHNRLAIIDLNSNANQPFFSNDNNFCIVFNRQSNLNIATQRNWDRIKK